ncbi:glutathione-dependent reductase [Halobacteriovorax marinus]|uniref:Glutathione-dependent reductase n=1 Tax=Halobacteriovorax marinus TaxID=97084 RepID=A0A1Y5F9G9_9BACT|nr:glutathione-dependent reductase [Halobacteriovorax marinus]
MSKLVDGKWIKGTIISSDKTGAYAREPRSFREFISSTNEVFTPDSGRYHLYVSYACPWATRALIYRKLKGLEEHITVSVVHPDLLENGWEFNTNYKDATSDEVNKAKYLYEVYQNADSLASTSVTVPVLWDKLTSTIVNNESSEIIRMFNSSFNDLTGNDLDFYPQEKREEIDKLNEQIYHAVNNGVYRAGFAKTQETYEQAVTKLFSCLDELEIILENKKFLTGDEMTEADLRLIPTLLRFDLVYYVHFKCNIRRISDYKNLSRYTKELYEIKEIKESTNFDHIKRHYYYSHKDINPYRIIPCGPEKLF